MKVETEIKSRIKTLKINKAIYMTGATYCTYKLGALTSFNYQHSLSKLTDIDIKKALLYFLICDVFFAFSSAFSQYEIDNSNEELKNIQNTIKFKNKEIITN